MAIVSFYRCGLYRLAFLFVSFLFAKSQETPSYDVPNFSTGTSYRTNYCPLHEAVEAGQIERRNALRGLNISVGFMRYQLNEETGAIDPENPDIAFEILDEIAAMAGFSYRNSYGVIDGPVDDETWTDILYWGVGVYDIIGEWFIESIHRLADGNLLYPEGYYDGNIIMVQRQTQEKSSASVDLFAWTTPFTPALWGLIAATTVVSGFVYYILDFFDSRVRGEHIDVSLAKSIFYAAFSFNGHYTHHPKSGETRILVFSLAFFFLIIVAAYTANLASFLVLRNRPEVVINSIQDAIRHNLIVCVAGGTAIDEHLQTYPTPPQIVRGDGNAGAVVDLLEGKCDILLTTKGEYEIFRRSAELNPYCDLEFIGRIVKFESAGFVVGDSEKHCASLLRDVLHLYILEMKNNPIFDLVWEQYWEKAATASCDFDGSTDEESISNESMGIENLSGMFLLHFIALCVALTCTLFKFCFQTKERKHSLMSDLYNASSWIMSAGSVRRPSDDNLTHFTDENAEKSNGIQRQQTQLHDSITEKNIGALKNETAVRTSSSESSVLVERVKAMLHESNQQYKKEMESMKKMLEEGNQQQRADMRSTKETLEVMKDKLDKSNQQHREEIILMHRQHQDEMGESQKRHQEEMKECWRSSRTKENK